MNYLYKNFLEDKRVYALNENYYKRFFKKAVSQEPKPYYNMSFRNGEKFYDGNPIFSTKINDRLVRIIQEEPESEKPYISASIEEKEDQKLEELILILELSKEIKPYLEKFLQKWLVEKLSKQAMIDYINTVETTI